MDLSHADARRLLGVRQGADEATVRQAFRREARRHHPDMGGSAARFHELRAALDLLVDQAAVTAPRTSPSTGRRAYPSTAGQYRSAAGIVWASGDPDTSSLDSTPVPGPGEAWSSDDLARAVAAALDVGASGRTADTSSPRLAAPVRGVSRRPGSMLNRATRHLSDDLLSRFEVRNAVTRGMPGHDLEVVMRFPSGARKHVERATLPAGWTVTRGPSATEAIAVVHPHRQPDATAVLAANTLTGLCAAIGWPVEQWRVPG